MTLRIHQEERTKLPSVKQKIVKMQNQRSMSILGDQKNIADDASSTSLCHTAMTRARR